MIITFAGHSKLNISDALKSKIEGVIKQYIHEEHTAFYCGGYGDFDFACAKIVKELKDEYRNIESLLVTPYITPEYKECLDAIKQSGLYDDTIYPPIESTPLKFAISKRNQYMVDCADLVIAYVRYSWGGAAKTLEYAKRKKKHIINLADFEK